MIIEYEKEYFNAYKKLVKELWNDITDEDITEITNEHLSGKEFIFLYKRNDEIIGFINTSVRNDYVPGSTEDGVYSGTDEVLPDRDGLLAHPLRGSTSGGEVTDIISQAAVLNHGCRCNQDAGIVDAGTHV